MGESTANPPTPDPGPPAEKTKPARAPQEAEYTPRSGVLQQYIDLARAMVESKTRKSWVVLLTLLVLALAVPALVIIMALKVPDKLAGEPWALAGVTGLGGVATTAKLYWSRRRK